MNSEHPPLRPIKVLVVDDSAVARKVLSLGLDSDPGIEVVGTAYDAYSGRDQLVRRAPDVVTLDIDMPGMDGIEWLRRVLPQYPVPVVVVSGLTERGADTTFKALQAGAVDFVTKPGPEGRDEMLAELIARVKVAATANVRATLRLRATSGRPAPARPGSARAAQDAPAEPPVVVIGASTGGTDAIHRLLQAVPVSGPAILIVQHIPAWFSLRFAEHLNNECAMEVREARQGDRILPGLALVAPGAHQMAVSGTATQPEVSVYEGDKVNGHRPSVDVLMGSAARVLGPRTLGVLLTGMGSDGANGLLAMHRTGARTLAQDRATSVVFGMPRAASRLGAVDRLLPLDGIAAVLAGLAAPRAPEHPGSPAARQHHKT